MTDGEAARRIVADNRYMTLATSGPEGAWIAPVAYVFNPSDGCFYFYSARDALHSRHLAAQPLAAIAIFNSTADSDVADGLQFQAHIEEVPETSLAPVMDFYFRQSFPDPAVRAHWLRPKEDFYDAAPQRFYKARPINLFKLDTQSVKIDRRVAISLQALRCL